MLVHEKPRETNKTTVTEAGPGRDQTAARSDKPEVTRPAHTIRRRVVALVVTAALVGIATITMIERPAQDPAGSTTSDRSFEIAETNRFNRLAPTTSDGSHEEAETNRFNRLAPTGNESHEQAETNRFNALRDLVSP